MIDVNLKNKITKNLKFTFGEPNARALLSTGIFGVLLESENFLFIFHKFLDLLREKLYNTTINARERSFLCLAYQKLFKRKEK